MRLVFFALACAGLDVTATNATVRLFVITAPRGDYGGWVQLLALAGVFGHACNLRWFVVEDAPRVSKRMSAVVDEFNEAACKGSSIHALRMV